MSKRLILGTILAFLFGVLMFWQVSMVRAAVSPQGGSESPIILPPITFGKALAIKNPSFDRISQVNIARGMQVLGPTPFTVEFWVKFNSLQNYNNQTLFRSGSRLNLFTETGPSGTGNKLAVITSDGTNQKSFVGPELPVGTWNHIALTYFPVSPTVSTPVNLALHVNGKTYSAPEMMPFSDDLSMLEIGKLYDGEIDELRISNIRRYDPQTPDYPVPKQAFGLYDSNTLVLIHFDDSVDNVAADRAPIYPQIQGDAKYIDSTVPFSFDRLGNKMNWRTNQVSLEADKFYMDVNGKRYFANAGVNLHSDPGNAGYTTLEAIWYENGVEMRLFMYFYAQNGRWGISEIRTYNGNNPGEWLYYKNFCQNEPDNACNNLGFPLTGSFTLGTPDDYRNQNITGAIYFENFKLQAFINRPAPIPPVITSVRPAWIEEKYKAQPWINQGEKVTVKGTGFSPVASENKIYIGGAYIGTANSASSDGTQLTFVFPISVDHYGFEIGNYYDLYVVNQNGKSNSVRMRLISPTVLFAVIPNPSRIGDIIILRGFNFGRTPGQVLLSLSYNNVGSAVKVMGGGVEGGAYWAEIRSWKNNEIKIGLPKALRYQGNKEYVVKVYGTYGTNVPGKTVYISNSIKLRVK